MNTFVQKRRKAPVSLTALIDIVFILLMFFMVTTSFTPLRSLSLNQSVAEVSNSDTAPNFLLLKEDGSIAVHKDKNITFESIGALLPQLTAQSNAEPSSKTKHYILIPAEKTGVQIIVDSLLTLHQAGFETTLGSPDNSFSDAANKQPSTPGIQNDVR